MDSLTPDFLILLIDDDPNVFDIITRVSKKTFPQALYLYCRTIQEAIDYFNTPTAVQPYLILLDIHFGTGVQDGLSFLPALKKLLDNQQLPIIILSSYADEARIEEAYSLGATSFLEKPQHYKGWKKCVDALLKYWKEVDLPGKSGKDNQTPTPFPNLD